ncbi:hypothetical protein BGX24_007719 [Mortierella sp. AD032]|nr:hypothetical protein BGX24_007719 [Mortierella sp. AD032]
MQAVRRINENGEPPSEAATSEVIHVASYPDPSLGKDIVLWDDILAAFKAEVVHVRSGTFVLPFLKGPDFKNLDPLRIASVPGVTLDVMVRKQSGKQELSLESLKEALFGTQQECGTPISALTSTTTATQTTALKQIPIGDPVEATKENSTKVDKPTAVTTPLPPPYREPHNQALSPTATGGGPLDDGQIVAQPQEDVTPPKVDAFKSADVPQEAEAPPKRIPTIEQRFVETQLKARLGDRDAQFTLGEMHDLGQGTVQCTSEATKWYKNAAYQGHIIAQYTLGKRCQVGGNDFYAARHWHLLAAEQGHAAAQYEVGSMFDQGLGGKMDQETALEWYAKAATQGNSDAQYNLGDVYYYGVAKTKVDYSKAVDWFLQAANQGHLPASNCAGNMYCIGRGVAQNYSKAAVWYLKAAENGDKEAQNSLAVLYEAGLGVPEDRDKAIEWYEKAVDGGYADAQKALDRLREQRGDWGW